MLELLASDYRSYTQDVLAFTLCLAAIVWGSGPERVVAVTWLVLFEGANRIYRFVLGEDYRLTDIDLFLASSDILAGVIWIALALYANRNYTLWIAAMQVLAMTAHVARGLVESISPIAYAAMAIAPGWFQLIFLGIGLTRHVQRKRKFGPYRDWRVPRQWPARVSENTIRRKLVAMLGYDFFAKRDEA